jgi:hypothetical protein
VIIKNNDKGVVFRFAQECVSEETINSITAAWLTGTPIGSEKFKEKIEQILGKAVALARKGPQKKVV